MKKVVLKLDLHDNKGKQKAMKTVACLTGIDSIAMDMKERKLTVIGDVDPVCVVSKLRKQWPSTDFVTVGPAKEEKKDGDKKDGGKKEGEKKPSELASYPYPPTYSYLVRVDESPTCCTIC